MFLIVKILMISFLFPSAKTLEKHFMIGSYVLLIELGKQTTIRIGKLGRIDFPTYWYVYVGSAMNGIKQRVNRHFSNQKKLHWHIDYFLQTASLQKAYYKESKHRTECEIAHVFAENFSSIPSFGSSDCTCNSHLFYGKRQDLVETINNLTMKKFNAK